MKKMFLLIIALLIPLVLFACGGETIDEDTAPVFSHVLVEGRRPLENNQIVPYEMNKDEEITVEVFFDNPSNQDINSITINGQRYRTNRFVEESTNQRIILHLTLRVAGNIEYAVENFVYSDVNSVNVDDNNRYQVNVLKNLPAAAILNQSTSTETLDLDVRVTDEDNVVEANTTEIVLYENDNEIQRKSLMPGIINNIVFSELLSDFEYRVEIYTNYNLDSGDGVVEDYLLLSYENLQTKAKNDPTMIINNTTIGLDSITLDLHVNDLDNVIVDNTVKVNILQDGIVVDSKTITTVQAIQTLTMENLATNTDYSIEILASVDHNNEDGVQTNVTLFETFFTTESRPLPTFNETVHSQTTERIDLTLFVEDNYNALMSDQLRLSLIDDNNQIVGETRYIESDLRISLRNLLADHTYTVNIYGYVTDIEEEVLLYTFEISTASKSTPSIGITDISINDGNILVNLTALSNPSNINTNVRLDLYENGKRIDSLDVNAQSIEFNVNYAEMNIYTAKLYLAYDLDDGHGMSDYELVDQMTFIETEDITENVSIALFDVSAYETDLVLRLNEIYDSYEVGSSYIELSHGSLEPQTFTITPGEVHSIKFDNLSPGALYTLKVISSYTNDGLTYENQVLYENTFTTDVPKLDNFVESIISIDQERIDFRLSFNDQYELLNEQWIRVDAVDLEGNVTASISYVDLDMRLSYRDLWSNYNYTFKVYALEGTTGSSVETQVHTFTASTSEKVMPTAAINDLTRIGNDFEVDLTGLSNPDDIYSKLTLVLYENGKAVLDEDVTTFGSYTFTYDYDADSTYAVKLYMDYDLHDSHGIQEALLLDQFTFAENIK